MPYDKLTDLPDGMKNHLPEHAQEIYRAAFNSAEDQCEEEEGNAHRVAPAVENEYEKDEQSGHWTPQGRPTFRRKDLPG